MSGTSADGIDAVVAEICGERTPVARARAGTRAPAFPAGVAAAHPARLPARDGGRDLRAELRAGRAFRARGAGGHPPGEAQAVGHRGHRLARADHPSPAERADAFDPADRRAGGHRGADGHHHHCRFPRARHGGGGARGAAGAVCRLGAVHRPTRPAHRAEHRRHRQPDLPAAARGAGAT